ncbi:MAG: hypothetical protein CM15mP120_13870 [Pseudomonadota bacterium]|nr:MAG: hypothetical protein CM15mP120_13870 [Pseudomonadota bacterium]
MRVGEVTWAALNGGLACRKTKVFVGNSTFCLVAEEFHLSLSRLVAESQFNH